MTDEERKAFLVEFGNRVKAIREQRKMSQEELARKIGYTTDNARSSVQKIEVGRSDPPASRIRALAQALDVPIAVLMGWTEFDEKACTSKLEDEAALFDEIEKRYGKTTFDAVSMYLQLDGDDQGEIRGEMKQMLKDKKYTVQKESYGA